MDTIYFVGRIDDSTFEENKGANIYEINSNFADILVFNIRTNNLLSIWLHLVEMLRAFKSEFYFTLIAK